MSQQKQTAVGSGISQTIQNFNRPKDLVDVCAEKLSIVLESIASVNFAMISEDRLVPPNITAKNVLNLIDTATAQQIEETYSVWDEISQSISADATGKLASEFQRAAFVLNSLYIAKFQGNFSGFKVHAVSIYCESTDADGDSAFLLAHLIHFMYLSCKIGQKP